MMAERLVSLLRRIGVSTLASLLFYGPVRADDVTGAGSTFVAPILTKWSTAYSASGGASLAYQPVGSGGGIAALRSELVDFAASDAPLKPAELRRFGLVQFPLVVGGVVPLVNLEGVKPAQMKFTGQLLAEIYLGKVTKWNDPKIAALNPDISLPAASIIVAHRVEASGTTFNWTNYLAKASPEWRSEVGVGLSVGWPVGMGAKGNEAVAAFVKQTRNSIGYAEYAYALRSKVAYALVQKMAGKFAVPNTTTFGLAAASANWSIADDFYAIITDAAGEDAYPIAATSFVLMYNTPKILARTREALGFFRWALQGGQKQASDLGFVALPPKVVSLVESYWESHFSLTAGSD
jgi:phosphate transport system substrate-binding protein